MSEQSKDGWQDIASAPKGDRDLLNVVRILAAFDTGRVDIVYWRPNARGNGGYWHSHIMEATRGQRYLRKNPPTHWMPLPAGPTPPSKG